MERLTISASLKYKEIIKETINNLQEIGITSLFPNLESGLKKEDITPDILKKLEEDHFEAIDNSEALYVICPEGYVGTLVSVEIGYAYAKGKPVIFSEKPNDLGLQSLASKYVGIGDLQNFKTFNIVELNRMRGDTHA